ncbi:putative ATP-dependent RNA helicase DHX35-like protein [Suillus clintonianus]|uniref:putative ATP-dependent RNA helicase DHX35-like protein n=1 Tax=Suillus clintonianus TaxID=1904413 RepID=UPI001B8868C1|nr:putative ATP-dependent RNA helicase DHX35-like protein [Suillus clintonianus]KAG2149203.1 putative ATP-dependent RNA helicase DHX35-like protein [Suillus clintonianus]
MSTLTFWKPGTAGPGSTLDRATEEEGNVVQSAPSHGSLSIQAQRERLPIWKHRQKLLHCVEKYGVTIVVGQTGSGKTTLSPRIWMGFRRVAAEVGTLLGDEVGYTIRFEDVSDKRRTRICYMTDGMLFRETLIDPLLSRYSVIMIDEAHERSLYTDLLLGVLKKSVQHSLIFAFGYLAKMTRFAELGASARRFG